MITNSRFGLDYLNDYSTAPESWCLNVYRHVGCVRVTWTTKKFLTTPFPLMSNIVYKFSCSRNENSLYIGMTTRHLVTRIQEHLHSKNSKFELCQSCEGKHLDVNNFGKCNSEYETKIQEALLIKKHNPQLNKQLHFFFYKNQYILSWGWLFLIFVFVKRVSMFWYLCNTCFILLRAKLIVL